MENKALTALQVVAKRLSIPEDKIEDAAWPDEHFHKAKMYDGRYLIYSWHVPEETFAVVNITDTHAAVSCSLGPYIETEASLDRIISAIKEFRDTPEESVARMTGHVYDTLFSEGVISDIPRSDEKGVGLIELSYSKVVPAKGKDVPINVFIVVTLKKLGSLEYQISYSDLHGYTEIVKAEDYKSLCEAIISKIRDAYQLSKQGLDPVVQSLTYEKG